MLLKTATQGDNKHSASLSESTVFMQASIIRMYVYMGRGETHDRVRH